jgi:hypothetical protein
MIGNGRQGDGVAGGKKAIFAVRMGHNPSVTQIGLYVAIWKLNDKI